MSVDGSQRLVDMVNQIGRFFVVQPGDMAAANVADHLRSFWEPTMRAEIVAWLDAGGEGLSPTAEAAVKLLAQTA